MGADPFTGLWIFRAERSTLTTAAPQNRVQSIEITPVGIRASEEISFGGEHSATVTVEAKFDGREYAVIGSPATDAISCTRADSHHISATGTKNGSVSLRETMTASADGDSFTLVFVVFRDGRQIAAGTAVFERTGEPVR
jgi:hypothetical protein